MSDTARGLLERSKPWRSDVRWPVVAIEAVLLIALGIFMLIDTDTAGDWLMQIIGVVLFVVSMQLAVESFRHEDRGMGSFDSFRAGIGVTVGLIATSIWWSDYISMGAVRLVLGWGLVVFAILQLVGFLTARGRAQFRISTAAISGLTLLLGILLLTSDSDSAHERINFLGVVMLVFGVLLAGLAWLLFQRQRPTTAENRQEGRPRTE